MTASIDLAKLEQKILNEIPLLQYMQISIKSLGEDYCIVGVPLGPNHNHKGTAFGGSLYAACTAACYALLYSLQSKGGLSEKDLVIAKGEIKYRKPVDSDFTVIAKIQLSDWQLVVDTFDEPKPFRIQVKAHIQNQISNEELCNFQGDFAFVEK